MQIVQVVVAVLKDNRGRVLISQRPPGKFMAGFWEFPGGKLQAGESAQSALKRELQEELGVIVQSARPLIQFAHSYPDMCVELDVWRVLHYQGKPYSAEGQELVWVKPEELVNWKLLPADVPIVIAIRLPPLMLVTPSPSADREGFLQRLQQALMRGVELVQLRTTGMGEAAFVDLARTALVVCHEHGARMLVNAEPALAQSTGADGVHLNNIRLAGLKARPVPGNLLVGASCHDETGIRMAAANQLDYVILGPVQATPSHPQSAHLGWDGFGQLVRHSRLPVYAIGGMSPGDIHDVRGLGGHGIAAIRALWEPQELVSS